MKINFKLTVVSRFATCDPKTWTAFKNVVRDIFDSYDVVGSYDSLQEDLEDVCNHFGLQHNPEDIEELIPNIRRWEG